MTLRRAHEIANVITGLSLVCGFISILLSLEHHFTFSCWAIIISVVLDGLDGQIARKNPVPSEFGKEFDSLVDVVCFGVAPAILGYMFVYHTFYFWAPIALFIYLSCSVVRLAQYNITPKDSLVDYFIGLPTTVSGGALASFILIYRRYTQSPPPLISLVFVVILAYLMISKVRYANLDRIKKVCCRLSVLATVLIIIAAAIGLLYFVSCVFLPEMAVFTVFVIYLFSPLFLQKFV